jgi:hypothetical protein
MMARENLTCGDAGSTSASKPKRQYTEGGDPKHAQMLTRPDAHETSHMDEYTLMMKQAMQGRA